MKKNMGKRIGCAALAAQIMLTPTAQAAVPLKTWADSAFTQDAIERRSERRLERFLWTKAQNVREEQRFSHLNVTVPSRNGEDVEKQQASESLGLLVLDETTSSTQRMQTPDAAAPMDQSIAFDDGTTTLTAENEADGETAADKEMSPAEATGPDETTIPDEATEPDETAKLDGATTPDTVDPSEETDPGLTMPPDVETEYDKDASPEEGGELPDIGISAGTPPAGETAAETPEGTGETDADEAVQPPEAAMYNAVPYSVPPYDGAAPADYLFAVFGFGSKYGPNEYIYINEHAEYSFEGDWYNIRNPYVDDILSGDVPIYAQSFSALYNGEWDYEEDKIFVWNEDEGKSYFNGALMTEDDFPRIPNKEFSGEWYIYDSVHPGEDDYEKKYSGEYGEFTEEDDVDSLINEIYLNCEYDENRDTVRFDKSTPLDDYLIYVDGNAYYLPIVGKWDLSSNAAATELALNAVSTGSDNGAAMPAYAVTENDTVEEFSVMTAEELKQKSTVDITQGLSDDQKEYYVRVPERVEGLTFDLLTFEPDSTVEIKVSYGGEETAVYGSDDLQHTVTANFPNNSADNPARGRWTFGDNDATIPLRCTSEDTKYNVVTITVTAPNGTSKKVYTFYVQRLAKARLELNPGNTPYGMIDRENSWDEAKKAEAKASFDHIGFSYEATPMIPQSKINNSGYIQQNGYHVNAWGSKDDPRYQNVDRDSGAIVVYQNAAFEEPGFCLYDGLGEKHEGATGIDVKWSLELTFVDKLGPEIARDDVSGDEHVWSGTGNVDNISLTGYNIKPGVYSLQYTYTDLYDETVYCDEGFARTVVVLPLRGDVDMDGAVTPADGVALQKLLADGYFADISNWQSRDMTKYLYYFRVCDVDGNHKGQVTDTDVNKLLAGYNAVLSGKECTYFYIPLNNIDDKTKSLAAVTQSPDKATISLEYLGLGTDLDNLDTTAKVDYDPDSPEVFWMEAQLGQTDRLPAEMRGGLSSLTITFTYDAAYVTPYLPNSSTSWADYIISQNSQWAGWTVQDADIGITPVDHDFKAISGLDQLVGSTSRELRFSITPPTGTTVTLADLETSGVLKVPFQMKGFPSGKTNTDCKLIELTMGMRDLSLATATGSATWNNGQSGETVTSVTANLADMLDYCGSTAVPLGQDNTPCYNVYVSTTEDNPVYGKEFWSTTYGLNGDKKEYLPHGPGYTLTSGSLPEGVTYRPSQGDLTGVPKEAGTFDFTITGSSIPFRLTVDPRILELTVKDVTKFYGETLTTKQTFTYDPTEIDSLDLDGSKPNRGLEDDLAALLEGYVRPTISLVTSITNQAAVQADTIPGDYTVLIQGGKSKNYSFRFTQSYEKDDNHPEVGTAKLTILERPILIDQVTKDPLTTLWSNLSFIRDLSETAEYDKNGTTEKTEFTFADATKYIDAAGYYVDPLSKQAIAPLTPTTGIVGTDALELAVTFDVIKNSEDGTGSGFNLTKETESRDARVTKVALETGKGQNQYYTLIQATPVNSDATVMVRKRQMIEFEVAHKPGTTSYQYGQGLVLDGLLLNVYYEDIKNDKVPYEQIGTIAKMEETGLTLQWVAADGAIPDQDSPKVENNESLSVESHNGKYICVTGPGDNPQRVWIGPYIVNPRTLTLTLQGATRYYGEEITDWTVQYDHSQLASWDQVKFPNKTGTIADLAELPGYSEPTIEQVIIGASGNTPVTKTTDVGTYYVLITMPSCANYTFNYICTTPTGGTSTRNDFGYAPLVIERRPILVTEIVSTAGSLFHDSDTNVIEVATAVVGGGAEGFKAELPKAEVNYYNSDGTVYSLADKMTLSKSAICYGDTVSLSYRATFETDNPTKNYFEMNGQEHKKQRVAVTELKLQENANNDNHNYQLLYPNWDAAENGWVGATETDSVAEGDIYRRRILGFEVLSAPKKTSYVYGETMRLDGLQVRIWYEGSEGGENKFETVKYVEERLGNVWRDTFTDRGLTISWSASGGPVASNRQQLSVAAHDGQKLVITGPQYPGETAKVQTVSTPITVLKKELTLTAKDISKYYGEENGTYEFTFDVSQLSDWDKAILGSVEAKGSATEQNTPAASAALSLINEPYENGNPKNEFVGPEFSTEVDRKTPVQDSAYPLNLSGGSMANYTFKMVPGGITIRKRPIRVEGIEKNPLYRVSESAQREVTRYTTCYQGEFGGESYADLRLTPQSGVGLTGDALVEGDGIGISLAFRYNTFPSFNDGTYEKEERVRAWGFKLLESRDSNNYELVSVPDSYSTGLFASAIVHKRDILAISIYQQPSKSTYTYGEALDLNGLLVSVTYDNGKVEIVSPESLEDVYIRYWDNPKKLPTVEELPGVIEEHPASSGDHLTIAKDDNGFAQNGQYLLITARARPKQPFVTPVVTDAPITVKPLELQYTLSAEDKDYDGNREAAGTITLTNVYSGDTVWVENGTDYKKNPIPADFAFQSGDYNNGITFTFTDENVSYRVADPANDLFVDESDITVEVTNIAIGGKDSENYHINSEVKINTPQLSGRDKAPAAKIHPIDRDAPDVKIDLEVDEHTNTVIVLPERPASEFGDSGDKKNGQIHYEYALVYYDEEGNWVQTEYQDSPYFGGERVRLDPSFEPDGTPVERPEGTGGGQTMNPDDVDFGSRDELPRGIYVGALVRLAQTNNYKESEPTASVREYDDDGVIADEAELKAAFQAACDAMDNVKLPAPEEDTDRLQERVKGPAIKTYTYRIDLMTTTETKNAEGEKVLIPALEEVWFTDTAEFASDKELDRLIENLRPVRYSGYFWDEEETIKVEFPLKLDETDGTVQLYMPVYKSSSSGGSIYIKPESIWIEPDELNLTLGDEPVKLEVMVSPSNAEVQSVSWRSSDESVVTVDKNGLVTVVGPGTATITARTLNGGLTATIEVRVEDAPKIPYADTMFNAGYTGAYMGLFNGRFEPERTVTRQELTVLMEHFFQMIEGREEAIPGEYIDVPKDADYIEQIRTLDKWGIVNGIGENMYAPNRPATRAEISIILCRMLDLPVEEDPNAPHAFIDAGPEDTWAWAYIDALAKAGITKGTGDDAYSPNRVLTRAEVAVFVARILTTKIDLKAEGLTIPTDVTKEHWAYESILRAINSGAVLLVRDSG